MRNNITPAELQRDLRRLVRTARIGFSGPFVDVNRGYAAVWMQCDAHGTVPHMTYNIENAEKVLRKIQWPLIDELNHAGATSNRSPDVFVDSAQSSTVIYFSLAKRGESWDKDTIAKAIDNASKASRVKVQGWKRMPIQPSSY